MNPFVDPTLHTPKSKGTSRAKFFLNENMTILGLGNPFCHLRHFVYIISNLSLSISFYFRENIELLSYSLNPKKVLTWENITKEFLSQYSYNKESHTTHCDLELIQQGEKQSSLDFLAHLKTKAFLILSQPEEK